MYNLDQTNIETANPFKWKHLLKRIAFPPDDTLPTKIDRALEKEEWICRIEPTCLQHGYSYKKDKIQLPVKHLFEKEGDYYLSLFHYTVHATGNRHHLNRFVPSRIDMDGGTTAYAQEELTAEFVTAMLAYTTGIPSVLQADNRCYLTYWIQEIKNKPEYLMNVLSDMLQAYNYLVARYPFLSGAKQKKTAKKELSGTHL